MTSPLPRFEARRSPRPRAGSCRPILLALAPLALAAACSRAEAADPGLLFLAEGFAPRTTVADGEPWRPPALGGEALTLAPDPEGSGFWIRQTLTHADWQGTPWSYNVVRARYAVAEQGVPPGGGPPVRLTGGDQPWRYVSLTRDARAIADCEPYVYTAARRNLLVALAPGELPPEELLLEVYVDRGRLRDGRWRVPLARYTADGIPVWPGHREELAVDLPRDAALYVRTAAHAHVHDGVEPPRVRFRVLLDGEELLSSEQEVSDEPRAVRHALPLPPEGRRGARLAFEVEGPAAVAAFLTPFVGPRTPPEPSLRRPNVVVFLADTFRADNLAAYGGELGLTPHLDRFAERSLCFERAWSTSVWTLPAHASLLSGLYPHQHGVTDRRLELPRAVQTLAERLRERGYRTGAVTGSGYVSRSFGMDQGFEWFDESWARWDAVASARAAEEFVAAEDGRPFFLFLQSYRAHGPYLVDPPTHERLGGVLGLERHWNDVNADYLRLTADWAEGDPPSPELSALFAEMQDLYRGAVADLDRGFGELLAALERHGRADDTWVIFTSDHGEAFGEHANVMHGQGVWDEVARIPLLVHGPELAAGRVRHAASLVDVAPTVAEITGTAAAAEWPGRSLLGLDTDRPAFVFDCSMGGGPFRVGIVDGDRKLAAFEPAASDAPVQLDAVFDLARDPGERQNLVDEVGTAPATGLLRRLHEVRRPLYSASSAELDASGRDALEALGYGGAD